MQRVLFWKLLTIGFLALLLLIPLSMIRGQISDRSAYRDVAAASIAESWTGPQKLVGPVLIVPYTRGWTEREWDREQEKYVLKEYTARQQLYLLPRQLQVDTRLDTELRYRGIFGLPVYTAAHRLAGDFDLAPVRALRARADLKALEPPRLAVHIGDIRGIAAVPRLSWGGQEIGFEAGSGMQGLQQGIHAPLPALPAELPESVAFGFSLQLRGMDRLEFVPVGESTTVSLSSSWPHPSFAGRYLPQQREIGPGGFTAVWRTTKFATDIERQAGACAGGECQALADNSFGLSLVDPVDAYLQSERSVKYGLLFVGLTFVAFFLFEVLGGRRIHPLQYLLVGLALSLFYLLLLSLAEHVSFAVSYLAATAACAGLIGYYLRFVLSSRGGALGFAAALAAIYGALFVIIRSEDHALLMGSALLFLTLGAVMVLTRRLDWYAVSEQAGRAARSVRVPKTDPG